MNYTDHKFRNQLLDKIAVCDRRIARLDGRLAEANAERTEVIEKRRIFVEAAERLKQWLPAPAATHTFGRTDVGVG